MILRILITLAAIVLILVVTLAAFAEYQKRNGMFFPSRYPEGSWATDSLRVKPREVFFPSVDGTRLHGWVFDAAPSSPLVIWFHGNAGNLSERAPAASEMAARGTTVLLFDYRGFGRSTDVKPSEASATEDSIAAYDFAVKDLQAKQRCVILWGESIGGPFAAYVATKRPAAALVMENSFPSLRRIGDTMYPVPLGIFALGDLDTLRWINESRLPTLVMHGRKDQVIPFSLGKELYDGITGQKDFFVSDRAGHSEIPSIEGDRFYDAVLHFIGSHCVGSNRGLTSEPGP